MRGARLTSKVSGLLCLALILGTSPVLPAARADDKPAAPVAPAPAAPVPAEKSGGLNLHPGEVKGTLLDLDGKTPIKDSKVVLSDASGKVVAETATDAKGDFALPEQPVGFYGLKVGQAEGTVNLKPAARATSMKLVLSPAVALSKRPVGSPAVKLADSDEGLGVFEIVLIVVGITVVVIGGGLGIAYASGSKAQFLAARVGNKIQFFPGKGGNGSSGGPLNEILNTTNPAQTGPINVVTTPNHPPDPTNTSGIHVSPIYP